MKKIALLVLLATGCARPICDDGCQVVERTYVHKYGVEVPQSEWDAHGKHGKVIMTMKNGVTVARNYNGGELDGETTYSFPHSDILEKTEVYTRGKVTAEKIQNYSGTPLQETVFDQAGGKIVKKWYENGSPRLIEKYKGAKLVEGEYTALNHQLDSRVDNAEGVRHVRDDFGQLLSVDTIEGGQMVLSTTYHLNGNPKETIPYVGGVIEGEKKTFYPGGEPASIEKWEAGVQNGLAVLYQNGEKVAEVPYEEGAKKGVERRYRDGNILVEEIAWANDNRHGPSVSYFGDKSKTDWYYQGKKQTKLNYDLLNTFTITKEMPES